MSSYSARHGTKYVYMGKLEQNAPIMPNTAKIVNGRDNLAVPWNVEDVNGWLTGPRHFRDYANLSFDRVNYWKMRSNGYIGSESIWGGVNFYPKAY